MEEKEKEEKKEEEEKEDRGRNTKGTREQVTEIRRFSSRGIIELKGHLGGGGSILHRVDTGEGCFRSRSPRAASQVPLETEIGGEGGWRGMILVLGRSGLVLDCPWDYVEVSCKLLD